MPAKVVQNPTFSGAGADAERKTLEYLKQLPTGNYIIPQCRVEATSDQKAYGSQEKCPDFVVIGPSIGVVILEVKDWNLWTNRYEFLDQYKIRKTDRGSGESAQLDNPFAQVDRYLHAMQKILEKNRREGDNLWISTFVVYPKLRRSEFEYNF